MLFSASERPRTCLEPGDLITQLFTWVCASGILLRPAFVYQEAGRVTGAGARHCRLAQVGFQLFVGD